MDSTAQHSTSALARIAEFRPLQFVGDISYSLYLWHWVVLSTFVKFFWDFTAPFVPKVMLPGVQNHQLELAMAFSVVLAAVSFRVVESGGKKLLCSTFPLVRGGGKLLLPLSTLVVAIVALALVTNSKFVFVNSLYPDKNMIHQAVLNLEDKCLGAKSLVNSECPSPYGVRDENFAAKVGNGILVQQSGLGDVPKMWGEKCYSAPINNVFDDPNNFCTLGDLNAAKTILFVGNSHAVTMSPAFDLLGKRYGYKVLFTAGPSSDRNPVCINLESPYKGWGHYVFTEVAKQADIVVSLSHDDDELDGKKMCTDYSVIDATRDANSLGKEIVVLQDSPGSPQIAQCLSSGVGCEIALTPEVESKMNYWIDKLRNTGENLKFKGVDLSSAFCAEQTCYSFVGGLQVYFDNNHITESYALSLADYIKRQAGL